MRIWTIGNNPWVMGGSVKYICVTDIKEVKGPFPVGKGFRAYLVTAPTGKTKVIEPISGAIIGDTIEQVREDVSSCEDVSVMLRQIEEATNLFNGSLRHETVEPSEFWRRLRML